MHTRYSLALGLLALGGCTAAEPVDPADEDVATAQTPAATPTAADPPATPSPTTTESPAPADALPAEELPGEYRIAGVDGGDINLPHAMTATIRDGRIRVVSDCVNAAWRYTYTRGRLATTRDPVVTCERGLLPEEEAVFAAFKAADRVARTPSNGLRFSGGGRSVTLFSQ